MENAERLGRQARPGFEPGTPSLPVSSVTTLPLDGRTATDLTLISIVVDSFLPASSIRRFTSIQILSNCSIHTSSLFQSDQITSFKLCYPLVMCKNPSVRLCYSRRKISQSKWNRNFDSLIEIAPYMHVYRRNSDALESRSSLKGH